MVILTPKCVHSFFFPSGEASRRIVSEKTMFSRQNTDESAGKQAYVCDQNLMQMKLFQHLITHNKVYKDYCKHLCNVILTQF